MLYLLSWKAWTTTGLSLFAIGDIAGDKYLQYGALGILFIAVILLFRELAAQRVANQVVIDRICGQQELDSQMKHSDSEKLNATLTTMQVSCAKTILERQVERDQWSDDRKTDLATHVSDRAADAATHASDRVADAAARATERAEDKAA